MKAMVLSTCNVGIYYGYITIRRKFGEKKIDLVVRWVFMMNYLLYAIEKMHMTQKNKNTVWQNTGVWMKNQNIMTITKNIFFVQLHM